MILVDTSAWGDFFRGAEPSASRVADLLEANEVAVAGPILTELLRGLRSRRDREAVTAALGGCHWLEQPGELWREAGLLGAVAAQKGYVVKSFDLLIAAYALAHDVALLTLDSDFGHLRKAGIELRLA